LHGSAASGRQWGGLAAQLGADIRLIAPDMPGYGGSAASSANICASLQAKAGGVSALLVACGRPVHLVGHSAGAAVAVKAALSRPDLVASLTLIEPVLFHLLGGAGRGERMLLQEMQKLAGIINASVADGNPALGMAHFVNFWNGEGYWMTLPAGTRIRLAGQCGQIVNDFAAAFAEDWPLAAAGDLALPVQLIMGLQSPPPALRVTEMLAETIDGARLMVVPDAGHMAPFTHPSIVNPMIARHIRLAETGPVSAVAVSGGRCAA
jgi:pimeloyl-ACP methyl ester carboxylesterase